MTTPSLIDLLESLACESPGVMDAQAYDALYNRLIEVERDLETISGLTTRVKELEERNNDLSWGLYPDRMGQ